VNRFVDDAMKPVELQRISQEETAHQLDQLREVRATRDRAAVDRALGAVEETARGTDNLLPPMREALRARATLGEVSDALRRVFGEYRPTSSH
jgi:methylmalonyl-CoA mutase, N-terminal domain